MYGWRVDCQILSTVALESAQPPATAGTAFSFTSEYIDTADLDVTHQLTRVGFRIAFTSDWTLSIVDEILKCALVIQLRWIIRHELAQLIMAPSSIWRAWRVANGLYSEWRPALGG